MADLGGMARNFELAGLGIRDMSLLVKDMGMKSMGLGLNARETVRMVNENLSNLNQYGFKNGIRGLEEMVRTSIEFRMNMQDIYTMADKVWDPDKALEMTANLQVIGGAFGDLNDPIKMMYDATNNVEGLQNAIIGAAKSLVTFNEEEGRFQVIGANLRRGKAMAEEFGMSLQKMTNIGIAAAERTAASTALLGRGLSLSKDQQEFITNLAHMREGKMTIEIPKIWQAKFGLEGKDTRIALDTLSQNQDRFIKSVSR